jgi:phage terminase large subunit-like protein
VDERDRLWQRKPEDYGEMWRLTIERQHRDLETGGDRGLVWDEDAADHVCEFFRKYLRHSKGKKWSGAPFDLEHSQEFHRIRPVFGWRKPAFKWDKTKPFDWDKHPYDPAKWVRRFNVAYVQLPKGTGKSTEAAGIGSYLLHEGEPAAEVYSAGAKKEQAKLVHEEAKRMHESSPSLSRRVNIVRDNISVPDTYSKWECFSKQAQGQDGVSPHGAIADEIHQWSWSGKEILDILIESARTKRTDPLIWLITTAGDNKFSLCYEYRLYAEKVLRGIIQDDSFFAMICEPSRAELDSLGWDSPRLAYLVNPGIGLTVEEYKVEDSINEAKASSLSKTKYQRYRLNMWVGEQADKMLDFEKFSDPAGRPWKPGLVGKKCILGLDMSNSRDITALTAIFPDVAKDQFYSLTWYWVPKDNVQKRVEKDNVPYDRWIEDGFLNACDGAWVDYKEIMNKILELHEVFDVEGVLMDAWNTGQLAQELIDDHDVKVIRVSQGILALNDACKFMQRVILTKRIIPEYNPVTEWMVSNCIAKQDPDGNIKPDKNKSEEKIDFVSAFVTAATMLVRNKATEEKTFIYDTQELGVLKNIV